MHTPLSIGVCIPVSPFEKRSQSSDKSTHTASICHFRPMRQDGKIVLSGMGKEEGGGAEEMDRSLRVGRRMWKEFLKKVGKTESITVQYLLHFGGGRENRLDCVVDIKNSDTIPGMEVNTVVGSGSIC